VDFVPKPVMTGFLFGLGLVVALGQLPKIFGVPAGSGGFFSQLWDLVGELGETSGWTLVLGAGGAAALVLLQRLAPQLPGTLIVLAGSIVVSAALDLASRGVDVVGELPDAAPDFAIPDVSWGDLADLLPAALGVMIVTAEAAAVSRSIASAQGYEVDVNRDVVALGGSNLLAGLSSGFVQSGGASQTLAAERAGGKTQLVSLVAAGLILLTGFFLAPLFEDLPQATLAAIVIVAIAGFFRFDELRRFARLRRTAVVLALVALLGVLVFGVLPGLLIAVALSLVELMGRLSKPPVTLLARNPATGAWGSKDRHRDWATVPATIVLGAEGPLFYANADTVKHRLLDAIETTDPRPSVLALDLARNDEIDVQTLDMLGARNGARGPWSRASPRGRACACPRAAAQERPRRAGARRTDLGCSREDRARLATTTPTASSTPRPASTTSRYARTTPGRVSDQITQTARPIISNDQNG
jgi:MFS superfamily sulfate permease-like transporter